METVKAKTSASAFANKLQLLLLLVCGASSISAQAQRELQMLEMMRSILGVASADLSARSQRATPMRFASSVGCDDSRSLSAESPEQLYDDDFNESPECGDFGCDEAFEPKPKLQPCLQPLQQQHLQHPCFVRVYVLREPLLQQDPCANFTLTTRSSSSNNPSSPSNPISPSSNSSPSNPNSNSNPRLNSSTTPSSNITASSSTSTTKKPKPKPRCKPKTRKIKLKPKQRQNSSNSTTTTSTTTTTAMPTTISSTTATTTTVADSTTTATTSDSNSTTEIAETSTELTTTTNSTAATTTTTSSNSTELPPTTTTVIYSYQQQLKSLRAQQRRSRKRNKKPKAKLDGVARPSEMVAELLAAPEDSSAAATATTTIATFADDETTTDCAAEEEETTTTTAFTTETENSLSSAAKATTTESEDCEDEDDMDYEATNQQDTNLCPHFTAPEETGPANLRRSSHTPTRYRKPMKNYVEPILYEGNFGKPRQRQERPAQRDYFVSNKQIMPRPRPKYRERVPPSIYVNNIVRGLKCNDEIGGEQPARLNAPAKRYRVGKDGRRYWLVRRPAGGGAAGDGGYMQPHMPRPRPRARQQAHYSENSGEDVSDSLEQDNEQYFDDGSALPWLRQQQTAQLDPCQVEQEQLDRQLERQRVREGARAIASAERLSERERLRDRDNESLVDYAPAHFFT